MNDLEVLEAVAARRLTPEEGAELLTGGAAEVRRREREAGFWSAATPLYLAATVMTATPWLRGNADWMPAATCGLLALFSAAQWWMHAGLVKEHDRRRALARLERLGRTLLREARRG